MKPTDNLMLARFAYPEVEWASVRGKRVFSKDKSRVFDASLGAHLFSVQKKLSREYNYRFKQTKDGWVASDYQEYKGGSITGHDTYPSLEACLVAVVRGLK